MPPSLVKKTMARLYQTRTIFGLWTYSRLYGYAKAQICYFPGTTASDDIASQQYPCDPYAYTTLCCPLGWTCFSNHLCVVTDEAAVGGEYSVGTALRGACTNPLWNDSVCGNFCLDDLDDGSLQSCGDGNWCCQSAVGAGTCNCRSGTGTFSIPDGEAQTIIGVTGGSTSTASQNAASSSTLPSASTSKTSSSSQTGTSKASTQSSSSTSSSHKSSSLTSSTSSSHTSSSSTSSTSSSHTSSSSTSHTSSSTSSAIAAAATSRPGLSVGQKAGISVGVVLGVAAVAVGAFLLWFFWWRHRERPHNVPAMSEADSDIYIPEPTSAVPGPILRPNPDPYEYRGNDGFRLSPVSDSGSFSRVGRGRGNQSWSGGYSGGFAGRATTERMMPYEGT